MCCQVHPSGIDSLSQPVPSKATPANCFTFSFFTACTTCLIMVNSFVAAHLQLPKVGSPLGRIANELSTLSIANWVLYRKFFPSNSYADTLVIIFCVEAGARPTDEFLSNITFPVFAFITYNELRAAFSWGSFSNF